MGQFYVEINSRLPPHIIAPPCGTCPNIRAIRTMLLTVIVSQLEVLADPTDPSVHRRILPTALPQPKCSSMRFLIVWLTP